MKKIFKNLLVFCTVLGSLFLTSSVKAIDFDPPQFKDENYKAQYVNQSVNDPITIEAGNSKEIIVRFKNIGTKNWSATGYNYISVYTVNEKYRSSIFAGANWLSKSQPTKLVKDTAVGQTGEFKIKLTAPQKIGEYKEDFYLAIENSTWVKGGYFYLKIKVVESNNKNSSTSSNSENESKPTPVASTPSNTAGDYNFTKNLGVGDSGNEVTQLQTLLKSKGYYTYAQITGYYGSITREAVVKMQKAWGLTPFPGTVGPQTINVLNSLNKKPVTAVTTDKTNDEIKTSPETVIKNQDYSADIIGITRSELIGTGGELLDYAVIYNNSGEKTWNKLILSEHGSRVVSSTAVSLSLADSSWQTEKKVTSLDKTTAKTKTVRVPFLLRAPTKKGNYIAEFVLSADGNDINGSRLKIPIKVTADAPSDYVEPNLPKDAGTRNLITEPDIQVGLYSTTNLVQFSSPFKYQVYAGTEPKGVLPANELASLKYSGKTYTFTSKSISFTSNNYLKVVAQEKNSYFEVPNYTRTVSYRGNANFNAYRGDLIFKLSQSKGIPYVVNELPLSDYIAGIAEVSNGSQPEYIKAVLVAARSYAYYHINNGTPKDKRTFDVYASTIDQLYLGYNSEIIMPNIVKNAENTFGEMVTYDGQVVTTPYFGHSDGYTRTWSEIWGGADRPWLKSVVAKYDEGLSMYGHGVGMSNRDASFRAVNDGWDYKTILGYYYSDTKVERVY